MAESNIIQMHDYAGNNQYPLTLASLVYDEDGETVGKKLALLLDWFEWGDDAHSSVKTKYHFWSEGQLGAGGIGEEGGSEAGGIGTITGILVNGVTYNEPDEFGVLTIPDYPTSLEWANISGRPENLSEFNNDKGYITEVTERMIVDATDAIPNSGKILISTGGAFGWVLYPRNLSDLTDDVVAGNYLPLTGGTMQGNIDIRQNAILYHAESDTSWANPKNSGLRILNSLSNQSDEAVSAYAVGLSVSGYYGFQLASDGGNMGLFYRSTGDGSYSGNWKTIAFTDSNVASADYATSAGNAITFDGYSRCVNGDSPSWGTVPSVGYDGVMDIGKYIDFRNDNSQHDFSTRLMCTGQYANVVCLPSTVGTLALLTDTVEAANRLATPRTIWGQSFDGTGDVSNHLTGVSYIEFRDTTTSSGIYQGNILNPNLEANDIGIYTPKLYISGNVGIGTMNPAYKLDVNGIAYATYGLSASSVSINRNPSTGGILNTSLSALKIEAYTSDVRVNVYKPTAAAATTLTLFNNGSLGVGTTSYEGYLLDVAGTGRFANNLIVGGQVGIGTSSPNELLHVAGNIRLKNDNDFGCFLKFGDYEHCYLYEDSDDHLKIYARQGIALLTNGKGVTTDTSLTIGSAVLSWDSTNNALKIEGNVYTTGQLSAGGVGTEVQKVFDIAAANDATTANTPYTASLTHNLNTYDLAVVVYEVTLQSDGITEKLTQVLADVTITDENEVTVYFASRKINKKYRIVIIG